MENKNNNENGTKGKLSRKKIMIIGLPIIVLISIVIGVSVYNEVNFKERTIKRLRGYKATLNYDQVLAKLNEAYEGRNNNPEKVEVHNVVFAEELEIIKENATKERLERESLEEDKEKVRIEDPKQIENRNEASFKIVNPTNRNINYMEMNIVYLDDKGVELSSDFTNESNISANSSRHKRVFLTAQEGVSQFSIEITRVDFGR